MDILLVSGYVTHFWIISIFTTYVYIYLQKPYNLVYSQGINGLTGGSRQSLNTNHTEPNTHKENPNPILDISTNLKET